MADNHANPQIAEEIVQAALQHVPFDGWRMTTLELAADDCGYDSAQLHSALPNGVDDALALYAQMADRDMVAAFEALEEMPDKTHLKIRALILCRLEQAMGHKQTVAKTMSYLAQPQQASMASKMLYDTIDLMWRTAGDEATDVSFYTKRAILAGVYSATLLAFISDDSGTMAKTEAFLDRRLQGVAQIPKVTKPAKAAVSKAASLVGGIASSLISRGRPF